MNATTLRGRCPSCCPDGGAYFDRVAGDQGDQKECRNCHSVFPIRRVKATGKTTPSQDRVLARIAEAFGFPLETEMVGRKAYFKGRNPMRNWLAGQSLNGSVGPNGKFTCLLHRVGGFIKITSFGGIDVYITESGCPPSREPRGD